MLAARHPSRPLEDRGAHRPVARSFRFERRSERASVSPIEPPNRASQGGGSFGGREWRMLAIVSPSSRRVSGSSSTTL